MFIRHGAPAPAAALALTLAAGCFTDGGGDTDAMNTSSSANINTSDSTGAPGTSEGSTADATTDSPTTADPSSSGDATTSDASGSCELNPACEPGMIEQGDPCEPCGALERVCRDNCQWGDWLCKDADSCNMWHLPEGATEWAGYRLEELDGAELAPQESIGAAFSSDATREIFVLTADRVHLLDIDALAWTDSFPRTALFPEAGDTPLLHAFSINLGLLLNGDVDGEEALSLFSEGTIWAYSLTGETLETALNSVGECCAEPQSPHQPYANEVHAQFVDIANKQSWADGTLEICDLPGEQVTAYAGHLADDGSVRMQSLRLCLDFYDTVDYGELTPFTLPGAPPSSESVTATAFLDGLVAFGATP